MASEALQKPKVTLHWLERSRSQRIVWLLEESKVDYTLKIYKRQPDKLAPPELKKIHPLGKSPVIEIEAPGATAGDKPRVEIIAESGWITEYLAEHFATHLVPSHWQPGREGQACGETESWMRYRYFLQYAEGSLLSLMQSYMLFSAIKGPDVPFFIRPLTRAICAKVEDFYFNPNLAANFGFLEQQLETSPDGGKYLCGKDLTAVDILLSFPLLAAVKGEYLVKSNYPKLSAYLDMIEASEGYKGAVKKTEELTGEPYVLF